MKIAVLAKGEVTRDLVEWLKKRADVEEYEHHDDIGRADLIVSYNYDKIIPGELLDRIPGVNLHIGYLPWNKGAHPVVWSALNGTPMGVTVHWMNLKLDEGQIIGRVIAGCFDSDTLRELYYGLHELVKEVFIDVFPGIRDSLGDFHYAKDFEKIKLPNGWDTTVKELREANR